MNKYHIRLEMNDGAYLLTDENQPIEAKNEREAINKFSKKSYEEFDLGDRYIKNISVKKVKSKEEELLDQQINNLEFKIENLEEDITSLKIRHWLALGISIVAIVSSFV